MRRASQCSAAAFADAAAISLIAVEPASGRILDVNPEAEREYGYPRDQFTQLLVEDLESGSPGMQLHRRRDGSQFGVRCDWRDTLMDGNPIRVLTVHRILTSAEREADHAVRFRVLEMITRNAPLAQIASAVSQIVEDRCEGVYVAMLTFRGEQLWYAAVPHLPADFITATDGAQPRDTTNALFPFSPEVIDITQDARWEDLREVAELHRICCVWSEPVISAAGEVSGVVAAFLRCVRAPSRQEHEALKSAASLAAIAIEHRNLIADLAHGASHDPLTGLPDTQLLRTRIERELSLCELTQGQVCLLEMDIDRLQTINDLAGRETGDRVIEQAARRLRASLPPTATLARLPGDEFAALIPNLSSLEEARGLAETVRAAMSQPFEIEEHQLTITTSIGFALHPLHCGDQNQSPADQLQRNAGAALGAAKRAGRDCACAYQSDWGESAGRRSVIESALTRAISRNEFRLAFQPQIGLREGRVIGAEALLRWHHPTIGIVSPTMAIPVAEDTGLIHSVGAWVLREACLTARRWSGMHAGNFRVAVNVSAMQLAREDFVEGVFAILEQTGASPSQLDLEITETAMVLKDSNPVVKLNRLQEAGVTLSLDDFGTGYSSFGSLRQIPVDVVKIDRAFVEMIRHEDDRPALLQNLVLIAKALGKQVLVEGVESAAQLAVVKALECDSVQGFWFGAPVDAEQFESLWLTSSVV